MEPTLLEIGHIAKAQGVRGEVVVTLVTNRLERLDPGSVLTARPPSAGSAKDESSCGTNRRLEVVTSRPHGGRHVVSFAGLASRSDAEALHGWRLYAEPAEAADELYVHELIGSTLETVDGRAVGEITAVEANPASDLLVVEGKWYVPARFVVRQEPGRVVVEVPEGLLE